ncbi:MAG: tubulin/FtsZ family protein [Dehalococcoidales bacterium]|jgi:cell division GTPase FtsZ|nr:tubulin/FtsZ family protein [Dehalococcoidales bacterium]
MKLVVVGFGQCGGRIADEFARLNKRARRYRGIEIVLDAFAVNTDSADLADLETIKAEYQHRILIGAGRTHGHGVAKISEVGAEIAKEDTDKVIDAMRTTKQFFEADAFLLVTGTAGGTGSGATPVMVKALKKRFDKPVYVLAALPFEHEKKTEERALYNTAVFLKSAYSVADAVILFDNQRYVRKDFSLKNNFSKINSLMVEPFYNLLCAGEENKAKHIGAKTLDAGDIMNTLAGWTAIGYGKSLLPLKTLLFRWTDDFAQKGDQTHLGLQAMDEAISELSIGCRPEDACRALYLVSAAARAMNVGLIKELGEHLRNVVPNAIIRNGDYPRGKGVLDITLVLSEFSDVEKVRSYYTKSAALVKEMNRRQKIKASKAGLTEEAGKDVPTLL